MVFFVGLPATGKSLLVNEFATIARAAGREVHLVQWDVARPAFEATEAGHRYPVVGGRSDPLILRAVGLWARVKVAAWSHEFESPDHVLIGETPFIGGRLIELARETDDASEPVLI